MYSAQGVALEAVALELVRHQQLPDRSITQAGVSTRRMDKLIETLGITSLSKSEVSVTAKELDTAVEAFRSCPLDASPGSGKSMAYIVPIIDRVAWEGSGHGRAARRGLSDERTGQQPVQQSREIPRQGQPQGHISEQVKGSRCHNT
jgi:hypothetical protein